MVGIQKAATSFRGKSICFRLFNGTYRQTYLNVITFGFWSIDTYFSRNVLLVCVRRLMVSSRVVKSIARSKYYFKDNDVDLLRKYGTDLHRFHHFQFLCRAVRPIIWGLLKEKSCRVCYVNGKMFYLPFSLCSRFKGMFWRCYARISLPILLRIKHQNACFNKMKRIWSALYNNNVYRKLLSMKQTL